MIVIQLILTLELVKQFLMEKFLLENFLKNTLERNEEQINSITEALQRAEADGKLNLSFDEDGDILLNPVELRKLGIAYENFFGNKSNKESS